MKNICLVCNYRVGSTSKIKELAKTHRLSNRWEIFGDSRKIYPEYKNIKKCNNNHVQKTLDKLKGGNTIFKLMGDQINFDLTVIEQLAKFCDFQYLYRKDFESQAKSWTAWLLSKNHNHHYGNKKTFHIDTDQRYFDEQTSILKENYLFFESVFKAFPGEISSLEQFDKKRPYDREYTWNFEPTMNIVYDTTNLEKLEREYYGYTTM